MQPLSEGGDQRRGAGLSGREPLPRCRAADIDLDPVELSDAAKALGGDLRTVAVEHFLQFAPCVYPAMRHADRLAALARVMELSTYLNYNKPAVINYARRRLRGRAVSTSRAEGLVNDIANIRMGKRQRMRWSPRGAHRVVTVRAAVLDGRLSEGKLKAA